MNSDVAGKQQAHSRYKTRSPHAGIFRIDLSSPSGRLARRKLQMDHRKRGVPRSYQAVRRAEPLEDETHGQVTRNYSFWFRITTAVRIAGESGITEAH